MTSHKPQFQLKHRSYMDRAVDRIETRQKFLIVCEGERTEPNYFNKFPVPKNVINVLGLGANTDSLVKEAIRLRNQSDEKYDQVWCVFDRDNFPAKNFNKAFEIASQNEIRVAYSNQAFELWYVLHFNYLDTAISRHQYKKILTRELKHKYDKKSKNIYFELLPNQKEAIKNAKTLYSQYKTNDPLNNIPSTTVHLLVEELIKYIKY